MEHSTKRLIAVVSILVIATAGVFAGLVTAQTTDQITITVTDSSNGQDSETADVTVSSDEEVPSGFPASAEKFTAIDTGDDGTLGPIEIAQAITKNANQGNVNGVEISPIEFAEIVTWNANQ